MHFTPKTASWQKEKAQPGKTSFLAWAFNSD